MPLSLVKGFFSLAAIFDSDGAPPERRGFRGWSGGLVRGRKAVLSAVLFFVVAANECGVLEKDRLPKSSQATADVERKAPARPQSAGWFEEMSPAWGLLKARGGGGVVSNAGFVAAWKRTKVSRVPPICRGFFGEAALRRGGDPPFPWPAHRRCLNRRWKRADASKWRGRGWAKFAG